jgi:glycosyltransferase involved in cell wall biosynthesis
MKLAYVTTYDSSDVHAWSGLGNYILRTLQANFETEEIGNLKDKFSIRNKIKNKVYPKLLSKDFQSSRDPSVLSYYANQVSQTLINSDSNVVFSPGTIPIAHLETEKPVVFWTDATFASIVNYYPDFSRLCNETIRNGHRMEQRALSNCRLAIYSSEWAARSAIQNYDVDPNKVKVVPFGANITCTRTALEVNQIIEKRDFEVCRLLFAGVDWLRKGGDVALEVANTLNRRGINTELHIVGCNPDISLPDFVIQHGFISKRTEAGRQKFDELMSNSHFLILPSKAECCAVVFAEASSFGLPSLASDTGGITTAIRDGKNGKTFDIESGAEEYCNYIQEIFNCKDRYQSLATSTYLEYSERLNWDSAGESIRKLVMQHCNDQVITDNS